MKTRQYAKKALQFSGRLVWNLPLNPVRLFAETMAISYRGHREAYDHINSAASPEERQLRQDAWDSTLRATRPARASYSFL